MPLPLQPPVRRPITELSPHAPFRPVRIPELPLAVAILRDRGEEAGFMDFVISKIDLNFVVCGGDDSEIRTERINTQVIAPAKLDVLDGAGEGLGAQRCGLLIRKDELSIVGHEEGWAVLEVPAPGGWPVLRNVMRHGCHEAAHAACDGCPLRRRQGCRVDGDTTEPASR